VLVVEDHNLDRQVLHFDRRQLLHVHDEAAVAVDIDNKSVGAGGDRPQSGGQPKAHGSEPPGGNPSPGLIILVPLGGPHLVLADSGADDGVAARELVQGRNGMLGHDEVVRNGELAEGVKEGLGTGKDTGSGCSVKSKMVHGQNESSNSLLMKQETCFDEPFTGLCAAHPAVLSVPYPSHELVMFDGFVASEKQGRYRTF
jgi:hypothetical protein